MQTQFEKRRRALASEIRKAGLDALLVTTAANWYYLTGFTGESGAVVVTPRKTTLVTDGRFTVQAREETAGISIVQQKGALYQGVAELAAQAGRRRIGFDPEIITVSQWKSLQREAGSKCRWVPATGLVEGLRSRKDAAELALMRKAAILVGEVLESVLPMLKPGIREREVASEIEYHMKQRGASGPAFESIVAFGERSALPHARPTSKRLKKNELVVLDVGAILTHYCSDMTRTVYVGRAPERVRTWYNAVLEAQSAAIDSVSAGITCGEVDAAARLVLTSYKLEHLFVHSTGHGLGLEVHEDPRLARGQKRILEPGNVVTIEPGVYLVGFGGIRIEDDVAVHSDRREVLTRAPRNLIEL